MSKYTTKIVSSLERIEFVLQTEMFQFLYLYNLMMYTFDILNLFYLT